MAFSGAMKLYFGLFPNQSVMQFGRELSALSYDEKCQFHQMLVGQGIECDPPTPPASTQAS